MLSQLNSLNVYEQDAINMSHGVNGVSVVKSIPYHLQVYEIIKNKILNGEIKCGEKINENSIASQLEVSRSPVREALRMLMQDEIVVSTSSGLIVTQMELNDMVEIYQCRIPVESFACRLAVPYITEADIATMYECIEKAKYYYNEENLNMVMEYNTLFHATIMNACPNMHLKSIIAHNHALVVLSRRQELAIYNWDKTYKEDHINIAEAVKNKDADLTERRVREHLIRGIEAYTNINASDMNL